MNTFKAEKLTSEATKKAPGATPIPPLEERLLQEKEILLRAQANVNEQVVGIANQLLLIERLLNPQEPETPPEPERKTEPPSDPPGTI